MTECRLLRGDCIEVMRSLPANSIDAVVCDPPYGLEFMSKDWDSFGGKAGGASITKLGFDKRPDAKGVPAFGKGLDSMRSFQQFSYEWGCEAFRVLKPGGHVVAFGGTRTYHRLAVGLEDAGFEIRDSLHWIYGSGFPKSLDVSKAIDAKLGNERPVVGSAVGIDPATTRPGFAGAAHSRVPNQTKAYDVTEAGSAEAQEWDGWGTGLKPAHEPVVLARKPLSGTVAETVLEHGTGALNIAASRVGVSGGASAVPGTRGAPQGSTDFPGRAEMVALDAGRWPSNVLLAHLPDCKGSGALHTDVLCVPGCPVAELNEVSDAARFFYVAKPKTRERIGGTMRNLHPTVKPIELMRYLVALVTPPGGTVLDPFLGSGSTGCAAMVEGFGFVGIEKDQDSFDTSLERVSDWAFAHGRSRPTTS